MSPAWTVPNRIETERLVLRRWEPETDVDSYHALMTASADHLSPWMPWARDEPLSLNEHLDWLRQCARWAADGTKGYLALLSRDDGRLIGSVGLHPAREEEIREIGYWLAPAHQGHGYVTEAVKALTRVAFEDSRVTRVEILTLPENAAAIAVAGRAGFRREGITHDTHAGVPMDLWARTAP
ncbi:GNAT family N-acetyltransferase [Demequina sp. NBRC 110055]|uniref:GNAT family N-acetyltransferase n=1 Tax=Demequina sp. NBRC 110055 TaxID=1570344 RepID=UPI000A078E7A|nr:GNAT family N-acetyltransferase [Demequina sp. NBRC 110055]